MLIAALLVVLILVILFREEIRFLIGSLILLSLGYYLISEFSEPVMTFFNNHPILSVGIIASLFILPGEILKEKKRRASREFLSNSGKDGAEDSAAVESREDNGGNKLPASKLRDSNTRRGVFSKRDENIKD